MEQHLDPKDLRMDTYRTGGGWNTIDNGIRITHIPTGLSVSEHECRSVHRNKVSALAKLTRLVFNSGPRITVEEMHIREVLKLAAEAAKLADIYPLIVENDRDVSYFQTPLGIWSPTAHLHDLYVLIRRCGLNVDFTERRVMKRYADGSVIMKYWVEEADEALAILRVAAEMRMKERDREEVANLQKRIAQLEGKTP